MQTVSNKLLVDGKLPVFVFPTTLSFYSDDTASHQQVLTVYNPYNFTLKYKVLCTAPKKYRVIDADGVIKSRCCVDIYIKHKEVCENNERVRDKFRLQVHELGQKSIIGKRDLTAILLPTKEICQNSDETFESLPQVSLSDQNVPGARDTGHNRLPTASQAATTLGPSWVILVAAVVCVLVLMLPIQGDEMSSLPTYCHVSVHQKLIASYILACSGPIHWTTPERDLI